MLYPIQVKIPKEWPLMAEMDSNHTRDDQHGGDCGDRQHH